MSTGATEISVGTGFGRWTPPLVTAIVFASAGWYAGPLAAVLTAIIAGSVAYLLHRSADINSTGLAPIGEGFNGYFEIAGIADATAEPPLKDPLTGTPCLWFGVQTQRLRRDKDRTRHWSVVARASSSRPFIVRDPTGACRVMPEGARFEFVGAPSPVSDGRPYLRHDLWIIRPGDKVYVLGELRAAAGEVQAVIGAPPGGAPFALGSSSPLEAEEIATRSPALRVLVALIAIVTVLWIAPRLAPRVEPPPALKVFVPPDTAAPGSRAERWAHEVAATRTDARETAEAQARARVEATVRLTSPYNREKLAQAEARLAALVILQKSAAHAPAGIVPPTIEVIDEFDFTRVLNMTQHDIELRLSRGRCRMSPKTGERQSRARNSAPADPAPVKVKPGVWQDFELSRSDCPQPERLSLEFEFYSGDEPLWASDGVLQERIDAQKSEIADLRGKLALQ